MRWCSLLIPLLVAGCASPPEPPPRPVGVTRTVGAWEGRGNQTLGFLSESGRLRVTWRTRNQQDSKDGSFRLTLHSGVSGRPLHVIAEHQGAGGATVEVEDDPRPFNFMVEASDVEWAISVEETVASSP
jgi:hypothetical protein